MRAAMASDAALASSSNPKLPPHLAFTGPPFPTHPLGPGAVPVAAPAAPLVAAGGAVGHMNGPLDMDGLPVGGFTKPPQQMQQQHAISYVTTIRNRFAKEPDTYRAFLKILHTYQKEQKGIKEVLEQVSELFADHPDLLMEFTYFLPDAVQDQAKERLHRAAKESVVRRKMAAKTNALLQKQGVGATGVSVPSPQAQLQAQTGKRSRADKEKGVGIVEGLKGSASAGEAIKDKIAKSLAGGGGQQNARKSNRRRLEGFPGQQTSSVTFFHASVERRLFDHIKDLLTGAGREPWSEFVRCLELFNQQLIDKNNMMSLVQELFGSAAGGGGSAVELFEEFKALLDSRANFESKGHEVWYAIPLSEIDFSQCRKCTPSYRALPKDFPPVQCSEMTPEDAAVLNNQWVSIPIGSEESHSFKHMRKNQYEEVLFKCEDERFEIDMIIDSNMCTIKLLEPIAEEIASLRSLENDRNSSVIKFTFQLEKWNMGTIHLNSISRIYGEHGAEILEMLRKNPAGTIPVVLRRLKQKDYEWRRARQDLDKQWKEMLERNYERSFDHRSFYFRQQDRRFYSPRHLVGDIKTRASGAPAPSNSNSALESEESLLRSVGVTTSLLPHLAPLCQAPHLVLTFDTIDTSIADSSHHNHVIHKDVYRVLCFAAESASLSSSDRERISALWRDFLKVFFNMPVHYLHSVTSGHEAACEEGPQAWAIGTRVLTVFGHGEVKNYRSSDCMYTIRLPFGDGFFSSSAIVGAEVLSSQALHAIGVAVDPETGAERIVNVNAPSNSSNAPGSSVSDPCKVFFGTQMCYVFLRLYHTIFTRLLFAKQLAENYAAHLSAAETTANKSNRIYGLPDRRGGLHSRPLYNSFLGQLMGSIEGSLDSNRYEEGLRLLLGNKSFVLLTLDKVVQQALKSLQVMANDDSVNKLVGLFIYHRTRAAKVDVPLYQAHVGHVLSNTLEEVYRLQLVCAPQGSAQVACIFLGNLTAGVVAEGVSKAPQRVLIDEVEDEVVQDTMSSNPSTMLVTTHPNIALEGNDLRDGDEEDERVTQDGEDPYDEGDVSSLLPF